VGLNRAHIYLHAMHRRLPSHLHNSCLFSLKRTPRHGMSKDTRGKFDERTGKGGSQSARRDIHRVYEVGDTGIAKFEVGL